MGLPFRAVPTRGIKYHACALSQPTVTSKHSCQHYAKKPAKRSLPMSDPTTTEPNTSTQAKAKGVHGGQHTTKHCREYFPPDSVPAPASFFHVNCRAAHLSRIFLEAAEPRLLSALFSHWPRNLSESAEPRVLPRIFMEVAAGRTFQIFHGSSGAEPSSGTSSPRKCLGNSWRRLLLEIPANLTSRTSFQGIAGSEFSRKLPSRACLKDVVSQK